MNQKEVLNKYILGMADLQIVRNPLSSEAVLILNETRRDIYQDAIALEVDRVKKHVVIKKNLDMSYVQELGDVLLEDSDQIPWLVSMTISDLPRIPRMDDQLLVEGIKYTISFVRPLNRSLSSVVILLIYPERAAEEDPLKVYRVEELTGGISITYGGNPKELAFTREAFTKKSLRQPFSSYVAAPSGWEVLIIFDSKTSPTRS